MMTRALKPIHAPPPQLQALLEKELKDGERLLWVEQPDARRVRRQGYWSMPFGAAILACVVLGLTRVAGDWTLVATLMVAFALLAVLGLGLLAMPYLMHSSACSMVYAITTERVLILTGGKPGALRTYRLRDLNEWITRPRADGSGDLVLEREEIEDSDGHTSIREYGFFALADVHQAERIIEGLHRGKGADAVLRRAALWEKYGHLL